MNENNDLIENYKQLAYENLKELKNIYEAKEYFGKIREICPEDIFAKYFYYFCDLVGNDFGSITNISAGNNIVKKIEDNYKECMNQSIENCNTEYIVSFLIQIYETIRFVHYKIYCDLCNTYGNDYLLYGSLFVKNLGHCADNLIKNFFNYIFDFFNNEEIFVNHILKDNICDKKN